MADDRDYVLQCAADGAVSYRGKRWEVHCRRCIRFRKRISCRRRRTAAQHATASYAVDCQRRCCAFADAAASSAAAAELSDPGSSGGGEHHAGAAVDDGAQCRRQRCWELRGRGYAPALCDALNCSAPKHNLRAMFKYRWVLFLFDLNVWGVSSFSEYIFLESVKIRYSGKRGFNP